MRRSIATVCLSGTLDEKLDAAAAAGFDGVEIFEPDLLSSPLRPSEVRERAEALGLSIDLYQPFRDFEAVAPAQLKRNLRRAEAKFDVMEQLGVDTILVCSNVSADAIDDDALAAEQLRTLAERAGERGLKIAYEALAWGRHVSEYDHAWRIVAAADHPALGTCLDSFHILSPRHRPRRDRHHPRREDLLPPARRRAVPDDGRPAVEPPLPLLPGPGRARRRRPRRRACSPPATRARCRSRSSTTSSARPTRCARRSTRCARCSCSRTGSPRARAARRVRVRGDRRRRELGRGHRGAAARDGLRPRRPAPQQAGAAVGARRHPGRAQPRRRRRGPRGRGDRRLQPRPGGQRDPRRGAARAAARAPPRRRRGRPDGRRGARRHRGLLLRHGLARRLPAHRRVRRRRRADRAHRPHHARAAVRGVRRGGPVLPLACSTCSRARARSWRRPTGSSAAARVAGRDGRVRVVLNVPALAGTRAGGAAARRVRVRRRARHRACDARARRAAAARAAATTTTTWPPGWSSSPRCWRSCASSTCSTTAAPTASSCTSTRPTSAGACSSRCSSGAAATAATAPRTHRSGWPRSARSPPVS